MASLILASGFSLGAIIKLSPELLQCAVGSLIGVVVSPDQDVDVGNISNKIIKKKLGNFSESMWRFFWSGYSKSFKHGQFGSHFPIYGTFVRVAYVYYWLIFMPHFVIWLLIPVSWSLIFVLTWYGKIFLSWCFVGLCSADLIHYVLDKLTKNAE